MSTGRRAGFAYLAGSVFFIFSESLRSRIIVPGDGAATLENVRSAETQFRVAMISDVATVVSFIVTAVLLFALLESIGLSAARTMLTFVLAQAALSIVAVVERYAILQLAHPDHLSALEPATRDALAGFMADLHVGIARVSDAFSGLWLLPLGQLLIGARNIPRIVGVLIVVAGICWLARFLVEMLAPELTAVASTLVLGTVGELVLIVFLIARGPRIAERSHQR